MLHILWVYLHSSIIFSHLVVSEDLSGSKICDNKSGIHTPMNTDNPEVNSVHFKGDQHLNWPVGMPFSVSMINWLSLSKLYFKTILPRPSSWLRSTLPCPSPIDQQRHGNNETLLSHVLHRIDIQTSRRGILNTDAFRSVPNMPTSYVF